MSNNFLKACALIAGLLFVTAADAQQAQYNSIATAYVTTTVSQSVVFDSTMQQGGDFTFSVLAHNGGGRAGQSDTANVKIEFYTSGGALVTSANTSYSANLPNPNAACGNPCIDPAVPWTTLSITKTLTSAQASTVAYAKVYMYGIDGSYWAGDYGPWYRAPTLTLGTGGNLLYNPEFGPYNNITAQGWTASPGFGACQGAWGGSNACIVNSSGQPGQSTAGLVANANGGGPSATGGTTSGQAGGYNSTMSTSNPTGGAPVTPPAPTVVSTAAGTPIVSTGQPVAGQPVVTTTTQQRVVNGVDANGNPTVTVYNDVVTTTTTPYTTTTTTTPTTVTTYSDGSTTTTNGSPTTTTSSSSVTTTSVAGGPVASVATTVPVDGVPVVTRGISTVSHVDTPGQTTTSSVNTRGQTMENKATFYQANKNTRSTDVARTIVTTDVTPITTTTTAVTPITTVTTTVTPVTTTITTTPTTTTVDGSGNVIGVSYGTPTSSSTTTQETVNVTTVNDQIVQTSVVNMEVIQTPVTTRGSASTAALSDSIKYSRTNPFLIDPLAARDANWIAPRVAYYSINGGKHMVGGLSFGRQETVENNTVGMAFDVAQTDSHGYNNNTDQNTSYSGTAYILNKQEALWYKAAVGVSTADMTGKISIPQFGLFNSQKAKQNMFYADLGVYSAESWNGFRPFAGVTLVHSQITGYSSTGNPLLAPAIPAKKNTQANPYAGIRWEYDKDIGLEFRVTQTRDFKTVGGVRATIKKEIDDNLSIDFIAGADKGSRYNNFYGMVGLTLKF